jgi:hypothetical protein
MLLLILATYLVYGCSWFWNQFYAVFVILFGIFAGASILSLWKSAIILTKAYLIIFLCTLVLGITLLFSLVEFPPDYYEFVLSKVAYETISSLIYFIICYLYINFYKKGSSDLSRIVSRNS